MNMNIPPLRIGYFSESDMVEALEKQSLCLNILQAVWLDFLVPT